MIVQGYIRDKASRRLVEGAKVTLTVGPGRPGVAPPGNDLEIAILRTGSGGFFRLQEDKSKLPAGQTLAIQVDHPNYELQRLFQPVADQIDVDIELEPRSGLREAPPPRFEKEKEEVELSRGPMIVSGHVRDHRTKNPIDDANVTLSIGKHELAVVQTGIDGFFQHREESDRYLGQRLTASVEHQGYHRYETSKTAASELKIEVELEPVGQGSIVERARFDFASMPAWVWMVFGVLLLTGILAMVFAAIAEPGSQRLLSVVGTAIAGVMITLPIAFPNLTGFQLEAVRGLFALALGALGALISDPFTDSAWAAPLAPLLDLAKGIIVAAVAYFTNPTGRIAKEARQKKVARPLPAGGLWERTRNYLGVALASSALVAAIVVAMYLWLIAAVPDVRQRTVEEARQELARVGLNVGATREQTAGQAPGTVVGTDPDAGEWVLKRSPVDLVVEAQAVAACSPESVAAALQAGDAGQMFTLGTVCVQQGGDQQDIGALELALRLFGAAANQRDGRASLCFAAFYDPDNLRCDEAGRLVPAKDRRFQSENEDPVVACRRYVEAVRLGNDLAGARLQQLAGTLDELGRQGNALAEACLQQSRKLVPQKDN